MNKWKSHKVYRCSFNNARQSSSHSSFIPNWLALLLQVKTEHPQNVHHAENLSKRTHFALDWSSFKSVQPVQQYHNLIFASKKHYYSNLVSSSSDNPKRLWQTGNKLLHRKSSSPLLSSTPGISLADSFASFFTDTKINI